MVQNVIEKRAVQRLWTVAQRLFKTHVEFPVHLLQGCMAASPWGCALWLLSGTSLNLMMVKGGAGIICDDPHCAM